MKLQAVVSGNAPFDSALFAD